MSQENQRLNLEDIAALSGVSRSTVSRVINNHPNVSKHTRRRVMEVVERLDFQPNRAARALASQRARVIGILVPHLVTDVFADPFFPLLLQSITARANQLDYGVTLWLTALEDGVQRLRRVLNDYLLDGLIIAEASVDRPFLESMIERNKRFVQVGRPSSRYNQINYIDVENEYGGRLMAEHFLARGRRQIGFIPGRMHLLSTKQRQQGFTAILQAAGLSPVIGPSGDFSEKSGYESMRWLLGQSVDAVFCASDLMALGAYKAIKSAGLRIPDDIAVGGFDDNPLALGAEPPLTTVRQPIKKMGELAVEGLITLLENDNPGLFQQILPVELVVRAST